MAGEHDHHIGHEHNNEDSHHHRKHRRKLSRRQRLRKLAVAVAAVTLAFNIVIHFYPLYKNGCGWAPNAELKVAAFGDPQITGYNDKMSLRKRLDVAGNDKFLEHTVHTVRRWLQPDYVAVMGDLISSQWIDTPEFHDRANRFSKIFPRNGPGIVLNVSGNHDIGYHGEFTDERLSRYTSRYGPVNFVVYPYPDVRIVTLDSLALDGPPIDAAYEAVWEFVHSLEDFDGSTLLLVHVPLYKPAGICRDGPLFEYYPEHEGGGIREQNHLTFDTSKKLLQAVFGSAGRGMILTGHDHEGCLASYTLECDVTKGFDYPIKEATVRSVMGEYGGNSGLVSGVRTDYGYDWSYSLCPFKVQHYWWATMVLSIITTTVALPVLLFV